MEVRARRDLKIAIGLLLIGLTGAALCVLLFGFGGDLPYRMPTRIAMVPPCATIAGLGLGIRQFRSARRRLVVARTMERVPSARVVTGKRH